MLGSAVFLGACAKDSPQDTWKPYGSEARKIDDLPNDPHLKSIDFWQTVDHPSEGKLRLPRNPALPGLGGMVFGNANRR